MSGLVGENVVKNNSSSICCATFFVYFLTIGGGMGVDFDRSARISGRPAIPPFQGGRVF